MKELSPFPGAASSQIPRGIGGPARGGDLGSRRAGTLWAPVEAASSLRRSCPARNDATPEKSWRAGAVELSQVRMEERKAKGEEIAAMSHICYDFWFPQTCLMFWLIKIEVLVGHLKLVLRFRHLPGHGS